MVSTDYELKILEAELEELQDLINCGEYRVDFNKVEMLIEEIELLIEDLQSNNIYHTNKSRQHFKKSNSHKYLLPYATFSLDSV